MNRRPAPAPPDLRRVDVGFTAGPSPTTALATTGDGASADLATLAADGASLALAPLTDADYDRPVTATEALAVLARLSLTIGWRASPERRAAVAMALAGRYTRAAVEKAGVDLGHDPDLARRLSFKEGTVTPADFARMIDGGGKAAAKTGLLTYPQMLARFEELGGGAMSTYKTADLFTVVRIEGEPKPFFREL